MTDLDADRRDDRHADPWAALRTLTAARIGVARAGASLATRPLLEFRLAHARARDAVHEPLDEPRMIAALAALGLPVLAVASAATDRRQYLMRPDLGRALAREAEATLAAAAGDAVDVAFVVSDGLSARAVQEHAPPLLAAVLPALSKQQWTIAPITFARLGRVALGDPIAQALRASIV